MGKWKQAKRYPGNSGKSRKKGARLLRPWGLEKEVELRSISGPQFPYLSANPTQSARLWQNEEGFVNRDVGIGSGLPQQALRRWKSEAGTGKAGSYFQIVC